MTTIQFRRALLGTAVAFAMLALAAPQTFAMPEPPAAAPVGAAGASICNFAITTTPPNPPGTTTGRNLVSVPRISPINATPDNPVANGFSKLCQRLDRPGGLAFDVNSDGLVDTGTLTQFDPRNGLVVSHNCANANAPSWDEGQAVEIRVSLGGGLGAQDISLIIPGVESTQKFAIYKNPSVASAKGKIYLPLPNSTTCVDRSCICSQLNLPNGTSVFTINTAPPSTGNIETYVCGSGGDANPALRVCEAALVFGADFPGAGTTAAGNTVNCLTPGADPAPCPATPSADFPTPLIF